MNTPEKKINIRTMNAEGMMDLMVKYGKKTPPIDIEPFRENVPYIKWEIPGIRIFPLKIRHLVSRGISKTLRFLSLRVTLEIQVNFHKWSGDIVAKSETLAIILFPLIWIMMHTADFLYEKILLNTMDISFSISESLEMMFADPQ